MLRARAFLALFAVSIALSCGSGPAGDVVTIPGASGGIGFDDMLFSKTLNRVVVPSGRTGGVALIDPDALTVKMIDGFTAVAKYDGKYDVGPTSVDEARGLLFVTDRSSERLVVVAPGDRVAISYVDLSAEPDHVRFSSVTSELWITEPLAQQIEVLSLPDGDDPVANLSGTISIPGGPEGLVIDNVRKRAYTQLWHGGVVAIDLASRKVIDNWSNGCADSRGIALDAKRGFLFTACYDGTTSTLDASSDGHVLSSIDRGSAPDNIGYSANLGHLYLAGAGFLTLLAVGDDGVLSYLAKRPAADSAHCATPDDEGNAWVCDPDDGQIYRVADAFPSSL